MSNLEASERTVSEPWNVEKAFTEVLKVQNRSVDVRKLLSNFQNENPIAHAHFGTTGNMHDLPTDLRILALNEIEIVNGWNDTQLRLKNLFRNYFEEKQLPSEPYVSPAGADPKLYAHFVPTGDWDRDEAIKMFPMIDFKIGFEYTSKFLSLISEHENHKTYTLPNPPSFFLNTTRPKDSNAPFLADIALGETVDRNKKNLYAHLSASLYFLGDLGKLGLNGVNEVLSPSEKSRRLFTALQSAVLK